MHKHLKQNTGSSKGKGESKVFPELSLLTERHAMKAHWGTGGIAPCILDLGTRWR
jgi:hypothetical protein